MTPSSVDALLTDLLPKRDHALVSRLLYEHGGLALLRRQSVHDLHAFGLSLEAARRLVAALDLGTRAIQAALPPQVPFNEPAQIAQLHADMGALPFEEARVMCLNGRGLLMRTHTVSYGSVNHCSVDMRAIFHPAVHCAAASIVLVHNHPSGTVGASPDDLRVTQQVIAAGRLLDIPLLEHLILVQGGSWWSMREMNRGLLWT